jgi:hypothetical protein
MAPDATLTAGSGAWLQPCATKASCRVTWFMRRVQTSSESGASEVP